MYVEVRDARLSDSHAHIAARSMTPAGDTSRELCHNLGGNVQGVEGGGGLKTHYLLSGIVVQQVMFRPRHPSDGLHQQSSDLVGLLRQRNSCVDGTVTSVTVDRTIMVE